MGYADGRQEECTGLIEHIQTPRRGLRSLAKPNGDGDVKKEDVTVFASQPYNYSALMLEKEATYQFSVEPGQKWKDGEVTCGPDGWDRDDVEFGIREIGIAGMEPFRRVSDADWFCLCGCVTDNDDHAFKIGKGPVEVEIKKSGEFLPFANDLKKYYGNNSGKIKVTVERIK